MELFIKIALRLQNTILLLVQTIMSCVKIVLLYRKPSSLPLKQSDKCTILGNGPSIKQTLEQHFDFLLSSELFCVNSFVETEYYQKLKPKNYILFDPIFFSVEGVQRENIKSVYKYLIERTSWEMYLYVPMNAKKSIFFQDCIQQNKNIKVVYFNYIVLEGFSWFKNWAFRNNMGMIQSQTVIVTALFLSVNRHFDSVFLVGADTSWHEFLQVNEDNVLSLKDTYLYNSGAQPKKDIVLIDPENKNKITMAVQFMSTAKVFRGYENLQAYATTQKVKVYNASVKSYIDAFERIKL